MNLNSANNIRLFLTMGQKIHRDTLLYDLINQKDIELVGESSSGSETLLLLEGSSPTTLIIEENLQDNDGLTISEMALEKNPALAIILLVDCDINRNRLSIYLDAGIKSVVSKQQAIHDLSRALNYTRTGQVYIDVEHYRLSSSVGVQTDLEKSNEKFNLLSAREQQVASLMSLRIPVIEISKELGASYKTIHTYKERIFTKLGFRRMAELVLFMQRLKVQKLQEQNIL